MDKRDLVYKKVEEFIDKQDIWCAETVCQADRVIENAYDFIVELCEIVGYKPYEEEEDEE